MALGERVVLRDQLAHHVERVAAAREPRHLLRGELQAGDRSIIEREVVGHGPEYTSRTPLRDRHVTVPVQR